MRISDHIFVNNHCISIKKNRKDLLHPPLKHIKSPDKGAFKWWEIKKSSATSFFICHYQTLPVSISKEIILTSETGLVQEAYYSKKTYCN